MSSHGKFTIAFAAMMLFDGGCIPAAASKEASTQSEKGHYRCAACGAVVASLKDRIIRDDSFEHRFANPAGFFYRIGCFQKAIGCTLRGEPTEFFTWFPGYAWTLALCRSCAAHLGWHYLGKHDDFYGLILDQLSAGD